MISTGSQNDTTSPWNAFEIELSHCTVPVESQSVFFPDQIEASNCSWKSFMNFEFDYLGNL